MVNSSDFWPRYGEMTSSLFNCICISNAVMVTTEMNFDPVGDGSICFKGGS